MCVPHAPPQGAHSVDPRCGPRFQLMEASGFGPPTSCLQSRRSPVRATPPTSYDSESYWHSTRNQLPGPAATRYSRWQENEVRGANRSMAVPSLVALRSRREEAPRGASCWWVCPNVKGVPTPLLSNGGTLSADCERTVNGMWWPRGGWRGSGMGQTCSTWFDPILARWGSQYAFERMPVGG